MSGVRTKSRAVHLRTPEQWWAVSSPLRADLLAMLEGLGPSTASELAGVLAKPADRLYHHLHVLESASLIEVMGHRKASRNSEAIYRIAGSTIRVELDPARPETVDGFLKCASALMRQCDREFSRCVRRSLACEFDGMARPTRERAGGGGERGPSSPPAGGSACAGSDADEPATLPRLRTEFARLTPAQRAEVETLVDRIVRLMDSARRQPEGIPTRVTVVLAPVS